MGGWGRGGRSFLTKGGGEGGVFLVIGFQLYLEVDGWIVGRGSTPVLLGQRRGGEGVPFHNQ
jgi:hypothetical protein